MLVIPRVIQKFNFVQSQELKIHLLQISLFWGSGKNTHIATPEQQQYYFMV